MSDLITEIEKAIDAKSESYHDDKLCLGFEDGAAFILPLLKKAIEAIPHDEKRISDELLKLLGSEK